LFGTNKLGLFTATPEGTLGIRVSGGIIPANSLGVAAFQWAPDSSLLTYVADQNIEGQFDLFRTTPDIVTPLFVKLSQFSVIGGDVTASGWSPNSFRIAYIADQSVLGFSELFSAFRTGTGIPLLVSTLGTPESDVENFAWSPNGTLVAFRADQDFDGVIELYTAPPTGIVNNTISNVAATGGQVQQFAWEPGGAGIGYIADQDTGGQFELYLSLPDGSDGEKVSGLLVAGGSVRRFEWVP
jgi:Tol biopolymer transport system component